MKKGGGNLTVVDIIPHNYDADLQYLKIPRFQINLTVNIGICLYELFM